MVFLKDTLSNMKNEYPLVSIIVPVYNAELFLPYCLSSILTQSYSNLEVILVDDGSTDSSPSFCDKIACTDNRIIVIHQKNRGIASAQNTGLNTVHGDYIAFVDNDDILDRRNIELLLRALLETGASMSKARWQQFGLSQLEEIKEKASIGVKAAAKYTILKNPLYLYQTVFCKSLRVIGNTLNFATEAKYFNEANWCRLYKREIWDKIRFPEGQYAQDTAIASNLYKIMPTVVDIETCLYYWLQRPDSVTHKMKSSSFYHDHVVAARRNMEICFNQRITPARSYYTLMGNLQHEKKVAKTDEEIQQYNRDEIIAQSLTSSLSPMNRLLCETLRQIRYFEKTVYDHKIKNMR